MKKLLFWIIIPLVVIFSGVFLWSYLYFGPNPDAMLKYMEKHPNKFAIYATWNGEVYANQHADTIMPLASAVKTIIALYAVHLIDSGVLSAEDRFDTADINCFYLPETDGGAHEAWLADMQSNNKIIASKIKLIDIIKGMIQYSSNANAEFLMDLIDLNLINKYKNRLGLSNHTDLFYFSSALYVLQNPNRIPYKSYLQNMEQMSYNRYVYLADSMHLQLKKQHGLNTKINLADLDLKVQRIWSNRLTGASVKDYAQLMQSLLADTLYSEKGNKLIHAIMKNPLPDEVKADTGYLYYGGKGGSTAFVLTEASYFKDKKNNTGSLAVFFNNLSSLDNMKLQMSLQAFEWEFYTNEEFRNNVKKSLTK